MMRSGPSLVLAVANSCSVSAALTNRIYLNPADVSRIPGGGRQPDLLRLSALVPSSTTGAAVLQLRTSPDVAVGTASLSSVQRRWLRLSMNETISVASVPPLRSVLASVCFNVALLSRTSAPPELAADQVAAAASRNFAGLPLVEGQLLFMEFNGTNLVMEVTATVGVPLGGPASASDSSPASDVSFMDASTLVRLSGVQPLVLVGGGPVGDLSSGAGSALGSTQGSGEIPEALSRVFDPGFDVASLGVGGLGPQFADVFRRAFASRVLPPEARSRLGIAPVRGILLYGPPGTGKTLMARTIGRLLAARRVRVVSGPEVLNRYVGASEENVRMLFADAERDWAAMGAKSPLHVIVIDEIDAICRQRGERAHAAGDSLVNQLLAKIDGYEVQDNILLIAMTNRRDLIDEALLRPGRLEVHIEVGLPDAAGRRAILRIHTEALQAAQAIDASVPLDEIAQNRTRNFSGADLAGLVRSATSFATARYIEASRSEGGDARTQNGSPVVFMVLPSDFDRALSEIAPAFGVAIGAAPCLGALNLFDIEGAVAAARALASTMAHQLRASQTRQVSTVLLHGPPGSGKTALAHAMAKSADFPCLRVVSAEGLMGLSERERVAAICRAFDDAHKSAHATVILDDIEGIIEFVRVGPRFSTSVLHAISAGLRKRPPHGRKLLGIATSARPAALRELGAIATFDAAVPLRSITHWTHAQTVLQGLGYRLEQTSDPAIEAAVRGAAPWTIGRLIAVAETALNKAQEDPGVGLGERFQMACEASEEARRLGSDEA